MAPLLVAIMHVMPVAMAFAFPLEVWLGIVAWRTEFVIPGVFCRPVVNGSLNVWRMIVKFAEPSKAIQAAVVAISLIVGCVCLICSAVILLRPAEALDSPPIADA